MQHISRLGSRVLTPGNGFDTVKFDSAIEPYRIGPDNGTIVLPDPILALKADRRFITMRWLSATFAMVVLTVLVSAPSGTAAPSFVLAEIDPSGVPTGTRTLERTKVRLTSDREG